MLSVNTYEDLGILTYQFSGLYPNFTSFVSREMVILAYFCD